VGVGTPEDVWLTMVSFILVRGRGGLEEKTFYIALLITNMTTGSKKKNAK
jgi:hypothetical protein